MILVILGTQDKTFPRLLKAIDKEIENGTIKDKVVVQAGQTKYESKNMEIFDLLPAPEFNKLMDDASLIITHGGAGSILNAIKKGKKIIATPRLAKYKEHHNDHQKQIIEEFAKQGYILELEDFNELGNMIEKALKFKPKKFESNTKNMVQLLENYIEDNNHISWFNRCHEFLTCFVYFLLNILIFCIFNIFNLNVFLINGITLLICEGIRFLFVKNNLIWRLIYIILDMGFLYLFISNSINPVMSKILSSTIMIVYNYLFIKKNR